MNGAGTSGDPWQVTDYDDLKKVGRGLDADTNTYALSDYYVLTANIDASASADENVDAPARSAGWLPIGIFTGELDGAGYAITGLTITREAAAQALFSQVDGTVKDLAMTNVTITKYNRGVCSFQYMAGIAADLYGTISRCLVTGLIDAEEGYYVGAIAGRVRSGGTVEDCYGGASVSNASADARISTIVGRLESGGTVRRCHGYGEIIRLHETPTTGGGCVGTSSGTITDCFWDGTINSESYHSGGGTEKTTALMQNIDTYTNTGNEDLDTAWSMVSIGSYTSQTWFIDSGNDYPRLWFEHSETSAPMPQYIYGA